MLAVVTAELVGMTPRSGGTYALIRRAYGPYPGFVIGWVDWLSFVVDIAIKAVVILEFVALLLPETAPWSTLLAIIVTTVFAAFQLRGIALSVFLFIPLYLVLIIGVLILRKREPESERPYRAWGHPYSTIVCLIGWTIISLFQAFVERETAVYALSMMAVSWPVYLYLVRK